jgi:hypothetical protein
VGGVADKLRLITFAKNHDRSKSAFLKKWAETALQAVKALALKPYNIKYITT